MATQRVACGSGAAAVLDASVVYRWVEQSCENQGVSLKVADRAVIAQLAVLFGGESHGRSNVFVAAS